MYSFRSSLIKYLSIITQKQEIRTIPKTAFTWNLSFSDHPEGKVSHWHLMGAICLERKPVISPDMTPLQKSYLNMIQKVEIEGSLLSDHEIQHRQELERAKNMKIEDEKNLDISLKQTAQDAEDQYTAELNKFQPASRESTENHNPRSLKRHLDKPLLLVVQQKLGNNYHWVLPQTIRKEGETMKESSERVLKETFGDTIQTVVIGNSPLGFYKYKYPKAARENEKMGAKVFFYKGMLLKGETSQECLKNNEQVKDYMWLTRSELKEFLQKDYCKAIESFLITEDAGKEISNERNEENDEMQKKAIRV